jgi:hypothetical protein
MTDPPQLLLHIVSLGVNGTGVYELIRSYDSVFPVITQCGHTFCVECAIKSWLQQAIKSPRYQGDNLNLAMTNCPTCRNPHPRVNFIIDLELARSERCETCKPFTDDVQLRGMVSDVLGKLPQAVKELSILLPGDKDVEELMVEYGQDGTAINEHLGRQK